MKGMIILVVGGILVGVGVIVFFAMGAAPSTVTINGVPTEAPGLVNLIRYAISGFLCLLGGIFFLGGVVAVMRGSKQKKRQMQIMATGIDAEGTVTYVDKNYKILVNNTPIYSIVEYTYTDRNGATHTRRIDQVNSEIVIRKQIQVGATVPIKYAADNPAESVLVLA